MCKLKEEPNYASGSAGAKNKRKTQNNKKKNKRNNLSAWFFGFAISLIPIIIVNFFEIYKSTGLTKEMVCAFITGMLGCVEIIFIGVSQATSLLIGESSLANNNTLHGLLITLVVIGAMLYVVANSASGYGNNAWVCNLIYIGVIFIIGVAFYLKRKD